MSSSSLKCARDKQGVIEFDMTDDMLANQKPFIDRFRAELAKRQEHRGTE
ncbi:MAG: hypothetical protein Fur0032_18110 [Terrimicrobiaceae bacterium]